MLENVHKIVARTVRQVLQKEGRLQANAVGSLQCMSNVKEVSIYELPGDRACGLGNRYWCRVNINRDLASGFVWYCYC